MQKPTSHSWFYRNDVNKNLKMKITQIIIIILASTNLLFAQSNLNEKLPTRGLCIAAPKPDGIARFVKFIDEELGPNHINTLILRVDYNYQYENHPELKDSIALSKSDVKKIVAACKKFNINLIPQIN